MFGIDSQPGGFQRPLVNVGGEDLQVGRLLGGGELFDEQHRQRISFLTGRAAGSPNADRFCGAAFQAVGIVHMFVGISSQPPLDQFRNDALLKHLKGFWLTKEAGHTDQQVLVQVRDFIGVFAQVVEIGRHLLDMTQSHPPLHAAQQHVLAVGAKVVFGPRFEHGQNAAELLARRFLRRWLQRTFDVRVADVFDQSVGHLLRR